MKVAVGSRPYAGPWGGGNRFVAALCEALTASDHAVVHDLDHDDIDIVLMIDPRIRSPNVCFGPGAILRHLVRRNPRAIVIHRVNECDERKGEAFINQKRQLCRRRDSLRRRMADPAAGLARAPALAMVRRPQWG
jgi:hypothetical protein